MAELSDDYCEKCGYMGDDEDYEEYSKKKFNFSEYLRSFLLRLSGFL